MSTQGTPQAEDMARRLRSVIVSVRDDLEVSRHIFQGEPSYIVRDPVSFQTNRLEPDEYEVFVALDGKRTLAEIHDSLKHKGIEEEEFYDFILSMHRSGMLALPVSDDEALYQRFSRRMAQARKSLMMSWLFFRVPLINPDAFLDRTVHYVRPLFTRWFFCIWLAMLAGFLTLVAIHRKELAEPLLGMLDTGTLPALWALLVLLKVLHEFGHAYACKVFGGKVPEMGAFFIAFTPCAYVDASAAWGFPSRTSRLIVNLGGMYFESFAAMAALAVWLMTDPSPVNELAYQVLVLASLVTVLFNLNPLARFDGYYVASDLMGIPNLRARSTQQLANVANRLFLGIRSSPLPFRPGVRFGLGLFGIASSIYRAVLVLSISALVATKFVVVGLGIAILFVAMTLFGWVTKLSRHLWFSPVTAPKRGRAIAVSVLVFAGIPAVIALVPVSRPAVAEGALQRERHSIIRAETPGFVHELEARQGDAVARGATLVRLENPDVTAALAEASALLEETRLNISRELAGNPVLAHEHRERLAADLAAVNAAQQRLDELTLEAPFAGVVTRCEHTDAQGRFLAPGDPILELQAGDWIAEVFAPSKVIAGADLRPGDTVPCRFPASPGRVVHATILEIAEAGTNKIEHQSLTNAGGGKIPVDARSGETIEPYFRITLSLGEMSDRRVADGMTVHVRFASRRDTLFEHARRSFLRFVNKLNTK